MRTKGTIRGSQLVLESLDLGFLLCEMGRTPPTAGARHRGRSPGAACAVVVSDGHLGLGTVGQGWGDGQV